MRLFSELLPEGATAVINADTEIAKDVAARARAHGLRIFTVGEKGSGLKLVSSVRDGFGQRLVLATESGQHEIYLPLVGDFQVSNALVAAGLVVATGTHRNGVLLAPLIADLCRRIVDDVAPPRGVEADLLDPGRFAPTRLEPGRDAAPRDREGVLA